ncbi:hypothetical protein [Croceicoccus naphthovorans]|uniref:hypothetical protein n=1 Tax=Croceicoccus naphthovorans TaxID=1348774 RepID=UPI00069E388C|nr:hypothetical protein [Croceicoccus naphthovorans]MBB3989166.1 hypothetical protein [Croceicoccus naphthovorans]
MRTIFPALTVAVLALTLAACGSDAPDPSSDGRQAEGEVLEGSISDAMIPLDQLRSQGETLEDAPIDGNEPAAEATNAANAPDEPATDESAGEEPEPVETPDEG